MDAKTARQATKHQMAVFYLKLKCHFCRVVLHPDSLRHGSHLKPQQILLMKKLLKSLVFADKFGLSFRTQFSVAHTKRAY